MCLAIPGRIISIKEKTAIVDFGGSRREISLILTPNAKIDDYVLVHAGFAIQIVEPQEAKKTIDILRKIYNE